MRKQNWADLWPDGSSSLTKEELQRLDDDEFRKLLRMVARREIRNTGHQKHAKELQRKLQLRRRTEKRTPISKKALNYKYLDCPNLTCIRPSREADWKPLAKRKSNTSEVDCSDFSFIDNPIGTMQAFEAIVRSECETKGFRINFDDRYVLDIGPYLLLGTLRERMTPVVLGGRITGSIRKVLEAVQVRSFLQMGSFGRIKSTDVWPFPLRGRRGGGESDPNANIAIQASRVERVADQTVASVNEWLGNLHPSEELTQVGASNLRTVVTEALNNAERHGRVGGDGEWVTAGFMARRLSQIGDEHSPLHVCNIGLLNIGRPVSETIREAPDDVLEQLNKYVELHRRSGLSSDTLATVFALQDGISRVDQGDGQPSGGTGMMDIVEFVNAVGRPYDNGLDTRVAIVSGRSYIRFSDVFCEGRAADDGRRIQWFNTENDVATPPSREHVMDLPCAFPGTLVTMRFVIDETIED